VTTTTTTETRPLLERAEAAIPGLAEAKEALRRVRERIAAPIDRGPSAGVLAPGSVLSRAAAAIVAGAAIADDLGLQVLAAEHVEQERAAQHAALQQIRADLERRVQSARASGTDQALAVVRAELEDVLARTREVDGALGAVRTPEAAMAAGPAAVARWQELLDLVGRLDTLRAAQLSLVTPELGGGGQLTEDHFRLGGMFRNIFDLTPELQARASHRRQPEVGFVDHFLARLGRHPTSNRGRSRAYGRRPTGPLFCGGSPPPRPNRGSQPSRS